LRRLRPIAVVLAVAALTVPAGVFATADGRVTAVPEPRADSATAALVKKLSTSQFGNVLVTPGFQALYYWTPEKRNPGEILCTGACARAWPPLYVKKGVVVPRRIAGFRGTFGTIVRPNGRRQLTYNRLPLYTYAHEGPRQVLCDDVDGWFVVRV
jgi:predicted lipoprotein with Yx(FWY)xxD motif